MRRNASNRVKEVSPLTPIPTLQDFKVVDRDNLGITGIPKDHDKSESLNAIMQETQHSLGVVLLKSFIPLPFPLMGRGETKMNMMLKQ